jgi:hypothetical protein
MLFSSSLYGFELATTIDKQDDEVNLETTGYAKVNLVKQQTSLKGNIYITGELSLKGAANITMWSKVDGNYYFSKLPILQQIRDENNLEFKIPFYSGDKLVTEIIIEVEMLSAGSIGIRRLLAGSD